MKDDQQQIDELEAALDGARHETRQWVDEHLKWRQRAEAAEAARDHLRARLRALQAYAQHLDECAARFTDNPRVDGVRDVCTCGYADLLAILSELEEEQREGQQ